jgi:hypothetical protein
MTTYQKWGPRWKPRRWRRLLVVSQLSHFIARVLHRHGFVDGEITRNEYRHIFFRQFVTPIVFLISIVMEYVFPKLFLGPYALFLIPVGLWCIDLRFKPRRSEKESKRPSWSEILWRAGRIIPWLIIVALAIWAMSF